MLLLNALESNNHPLVNIL